MKHNIYYTNLFLNSKLGSTQDFFHGTSKEFSPGDLILPPSKTNNISEKGRIKNLDKIFFTKDFGYAKIYAGRAAQALGGKPRVYKIKPHSPIEIMDQSPGRSIYTAPSAVVEIEVVKKFKN